MILYLPDLSDYHPGLQNRIPQEYARSLLQREEELGRNDLILPIYYKKCNEKAISGKLWEKLIQRKYFDFRKLKNKKIDSDNVQNTIEVLAQHMKDAIKRISSRNSFLYS